MNGRQLDPNPEVFAPSPAWWAVLYRTKDACSKRVDLYRIAAKQVSQYTSWHLEYVYRSLLCRQKSKGRHDPQDEAEGAKAIAQGIFSLKMEADHSKTWAEEM